MVNSKKEFHHRCISKMLFIDMEQFSVFFKNFVDRFGTTYLRNGFLWSCFSKILLIVFRIATNLKTRLSKDYSWKILFVDSKTSTTKVKGTLKGHLKVH